MNIFDTESRGRRTVRGLWIGLIAALTLTGLSAPGAASDEDDLNVVADATLGVQFYVIDPPYDTSNVAGFFEQYRYIRDQGATLPFFLDLTHVNAGIQRADDTYLLRLERWSRNPLNSNGYLDVNWRGLDVDFDYRRYRSDSLRFFPKGTWGGETPVPDNAFGVQYHSDLCPPTPLDPSPCATSPFGLEPGDVFENNNRIFVTRQSVGGELALRPEGFHQPHPFLAQWRTRARYETRTGYRQDSFVLASPEENPGNNLNQGFRGHRRKIDQAVTTAGTTFVIAPLGLFESSLSFDYQEFREQAPIVTLGSLEVPGAIPNPNPPGNERAFFFVPDTERFTGTLQLAKRTDSAVFNAGVSGTRLEQSGRFSPLQDYYGLCEGRGSNCDNALTLVSAHLDGKISLPANLSLSIWGKYNYRDSDEARQRFLEQAFSALGTQGIQESPYIQERNEIRGGVEIAARLVRGIHLAAGYRFDRVDRDLVFSNTGYGIQPAVSLINPKSFDSEIFLRFRLRLLRSLRLSGETSGTWASEVAYPNDLSEAFRLRLRASYDLARLLSLPVSLSAGGHVLDGKNDEFPLPNSDPAAGRNSQFEKTAWGYDITLTAVPYEGWVGFATFSQDVEEQSFGYIRTDYPRYLDSLIPISFYIDSYPEYKSNVKSLTFGLSFTAWQRLQSDVSAALTWVDVGASGAADVGSNVGNLINQANRIEDRILTLNTEIEYQINENVSVGAGYRYQQFVNGVRLDPIQLDETIHTLSAQISIDFAGLYASVKKSD